jgi:tRNA-binding protein
MRQNSCLGSYFVCYTHGMSELISMADFQKVDIRLGRVVAVQDFPEARKPAYKLTIDLGPEIGIKKSSAQLVGAHAKEELEGTYVLCVVNFPPRQVGPFMSEVLTLGFKNTAGEGHIVATASKAEVALGDRLA